MVTFIYEIKGQTGLVHEFKVDEFNEDNDGYWQDIADQLDTTDAVCYTGYGFIKYPNGAVYWGNFVNGKFDGEGILMYPENDVHDQVKYQGH